MGPLAIAAAPALIGGIAGLFGGERANAANARMARDQMAFQERMRSTQYQTAVEDMKKAGLNPALAYHQGGAGTPTGASSVSQNTGASAIEGATSALAAVQTVRKNAAEIRKLELEGTAQDIRNQISSMERRQAAMFDAIFDHALVDARKRGEIARNVAAEHDAKTAEYNKRLTELEIPEAEAIAAMYRGTLGKVLPYINSASGVFRGLSGLGGLLSRFSKRAPRSGTRTRTTQRVGKDWSETFERFEEH